MAIGKKDRAGESLLTFPAYQRSQQILLSQQTAVGKCFNLFHFSRLSFALRFLRQVKKATLMESVSVSLMGSIWSSTIFVEDPTFCVSSAKLLLWARIANMSKINQNNLIL